MAHVAGGCFTDGKVAAYDTFRSRHQAINDAASAVRVKMGLAPLTCATKTIMFAFQSQSTDAQLVSEPPLHFLPGTRPPLALMMCDVRTNPQDESLASTSPVGAPFGSRIIVAEGSVAGSVAPASRPP